MTVRDRKDCNFIDNQMRDENNDEQDTSPANGKMGNSTKREKMKEKWRQFVYCK